MRAAPRLVGHLFPRLLGQSEYNTLLKNLSPLMDVLFGTYRCPDREPERLGLREPIAATYVGQLLHPFLPSRRAERAPAAPRAAGVSRAA